MKTSTCITTFAMAFLMLFSFNANAQKFSELDKSPMDASSFPLDYKDSKKSLKIIYSRPQLKGRSLDELAPNGKVWRTGANEAAELTLYSPMVFGDYKLEAGTYTFYLIPGEKYWTAIINSDLNVWGSYYYKEHNDVARMRVLLNESNDTVEAFSIAFNEAEKGNTIMMNIAWGTMRLSIPFTPNL